jgi:glucosamine--fructose-6-phosphate aminotransferase (isomerizing)
MSVPARSLGISTLRDDGIQYRYDSDVLTLLKQWYRHPLGDFSLAFFRPAPMASEEIGAIAMFSTKRIVARCVGVIDNLSEIQDDLLSYGYTFNTQKAAETVSCLFSHYLATCQILPSEVMRMVMKRLKGHFALMILLSDGKLLIVAASRGYPLAIAKFSTTVYFSTDTGILTHFFLSVMPVTSQTEPVIFCATSCYQTDIFSQISLPFG